MSSDKQMTTRAAVRADAMRRASEAWQLRIAGHTWEQVAATVGFSDPANAVRAVRSYFGTLPTPARDELRNLARARGEALWAEAFRDVLDRRPGAVRAAQAVLQRQAALDGLDQPMRAQIEVSSDEIDMLARRLVEATGELRAEGDFLDWEDAEVVEDDA